jgi:membrane-bound ClpP family serine protease
VVLSVRRVGSQSCMFRLGGILPLLLVLLPLLQLGSVLCTLSLGLGFTGFLFAEVFAVHTAKGFLVACLGGAIFTSRARSKKSSDLHGYVLSK